MPAFDHHRGHGMNAGFLPLALGGTHFVRELVACQDLLRTVCIESCLSTAVSNTVS